MTKRTLMTSLVVLLALLLNTDCASGGGDLNRAETQRRYGVRMARMNLWREALFRFKRAVELDASNANAHNNLAVAYEAIGDFDNALREYREAMKLDKSNQYIQKNYSRFVEFTSRNKKRQKPQTASSTEAPAPAAAPAATPAATPPTPPTQPPGASPQPTSTQPAATPPAATQPPTPPPPPGGAQ